MAEINFVSAKVEKGSGSTIKPLTFLENVKIPPPHDTLGPKYSFNNKINENINPKFIRPDDAMIEVRDKDGYTEFKNYYGVVDLLHDKGIVTLKEKEDLKTPEYYMISPTKLDEVSKLYEKYIITKNLKY